METQKITINIETNGEKCEMTDQEIKTWYEENIAKLFNPEYGTPKISVTVERE